MPLNKSLRIQELERRQREEEEASRRRARELAVGIATGSQNDSTSNSTNSSTSSQNSAQSSQRGSQSPSAVDRLFKSTARKYTNNASADTTRRNSRGQTVSGRDRTRSAVNSPNASGPKIKEDTGEWAKNEAYGALTGFNKELASAADFLLPDVITPNKVQSALDYYRNADEEQQKKVQASRGDSRLREIAGTIGGETLKNIPAAAMAMLSGGASVGAQVAGEAVPSLLEGARIANTGNIVSRALDEVARTSGRNPMFWETFIRTVGPTYDNEIQNGADPVRATLSAYANALLNAQIEIGGGIEKYDPSEVFWKAAARSAKEEGLEEVQQYAVENLVNKAVGSNTSKWFSMKRGEDAVINPIDMAEQGFYGAAAGGLMSGGRTLGVNAVNSIRNDNYRNANPDIEERANELIQRASVQGREGEMSTRAQNLAEEVSEQMARGEAPTAYQMRELERAVATDEYYNQQNYENSSQERYNQAVKEGKADTVKQTGTADEYYGFRRGLSETEQRNYDRVKAVMGENASENSVTAVSRLMTGSESNRDIDTILLDPEARSAVEELTEVTLPINNVKARAELENLALVNQIANRDRILEQTHNEIRTNMSRRGGEFFDKNYDEAVATIDVPNAADIYENFYSRFYTAGTVEGADFEKTYNRIISPLVEDFGEDLGTKISQVFTHDFAQKVFAEGQIAMNSARAKAQGRNLSVKASENPAGFTYEEEARKHISDREAELFTKLAERAKVHIRLVSSIAGGKANGSYDPETGVILIAADSDNKFITVFKHELTHHLKNTSPEMYQKLEDFVFKKWYDGDPEKMEARVQEYQKRYGFRPDEAREEIIADASEAFFTDQGAINDAVTFNEKMARAIHDGIKSLLDTFLDLVDTDRRADKGYGDFLEDLDILRDAEKMWLEALNESVGKHKGSVGNKADLDAFLKENGLRELPQTKKMSLKATEDSEGKRLTEGQKRFFKDSRATDKDGKLVTVYHTTENGGFTVFDPKYSDDKRSLFFASNFDISQTYGRGANRPINPDMPEFTSWDDFENYAAENFRGWDNTKLLSDNLGAVVYPNEQAPYGTDEIPFEKWIRRKSKHTQYDAYISIPLPNGNYYNLRNDSPSGLLKDINDVLKRSNGKGYYACYLNLENPLVVDGHGMNWNKIDTDFVVTDGQQKLEKAADKRVLSVRNRVPFGYSLDTNNKPIYKMFLAVTFEEKDANGKWIRNTDQSVHLRASSVDDLDKQARKQFIEWGYSKSYWDNVVRKNSNNGEYRASNDGDYIDSKGNLIDKSKYIKGQTLSGYTNTRGLSKIAKDNGYDGVIIRNIADIGGRSRLRSGASPYSDIYIAFNSNQVKLTSNEDPTEDDDIRYSIKEPNLGYHAGDLGKSIGDSYYSQSFDRDTGHFGFGTYFVGDKAYFKGTGIGDRPVETVDFDKYNLFRPRNYRNGIELHEALKVLDGYAKRYSDLSRLTDWDNWKERSYLTGGILNDLDEYIWQMDERENPSKELKAKIDKYIEGMPEYYRNELERKVNSRYEEAQKRSADKELVKESLGREFDRLYGDRGRSYLYDSKEAYVEGKLDDEIRYINENKALSLEDWKYYEAESVIKDYTKGLTEDIDNVRDIDFKLWMALGGRKESIQNALKKTEEIIKAYPEVTKGLDSAATVFMKQLGYEGVDVRGIEGLDNTRYGSVIYDLKDEDLARKKEIGRAKYSIKDAPSMDKLDKSGAVLTKNNGDPIVKFEENGSVQFSIKTYDDNGRRIYKEYLDKMVKNRQLTKAEAKQMQDELETIYKITKSFADSGKYAPFTAWSNAEVVTGENGKPVFSAIKKNSEYKMNIDFSTICKKRRTLDNVFRVMVNRGLFEQLDLNKDESAALVVNINDLIREHGFEAACALCFVEARRYRQQQTATTFRDMWNGLVESMYKDKSKIEYFNYGENNEKKPVPDGIHTMSDKDLNLTRLKKLANAKNDEGKPLQTAEAKAARLLLRDPSQRKLMLVGDMMASTGFENMQVKNPELMKIYNAKKGTGGAKSSFGDVQYLNEILKPRSFGRMSAYAVSGVRIQSFSDYVPRMVFDYVQVIADLSAKRLPAHAYTKEVLFALQFGLTGAKINMSLVPDVVADGVAPGLDKNGDYVWNKEGTFPWEDYTDKNGRKMPGARTIQKAKGYKENCGTIAVGISDQQIWKMLLDPEIQMVIPYHKSSLNPLVAAMTNVDRFTDYTEYQNTRDKNGKAVEKEFDWDRKLFRLSHDSNNKLLPRSEWGDVQALVKEYVDWCNKHEYTPKFSQFLYMEDGSINPGYYKMLEDFALLDNDGTFKPQDDVKMSFPTDESAFGSMASLIEQGLDEDTKLEAKRSSEINGIVDEIEDMIKDGSITKQTIFSEALAKKMEDKFQYSLKSNGESRSYQSTITKLENQVKDLKSEFKRTNLKTADQRDVRIQAGRLITRHGSNMQAQKSLTDTFNEIFRLYKEKGTDAFDEVYEIAKNEAVNIVNNISIVHNEGEETYKAIKDYLRNTPVTISEDMKRNITDFNDFRKRYFGKLKITNGETTNIDNVYMELNELFPEQFTEDYVNPADQLYHMADVLDNYAPYYETLDGASEEMQDYVVDIAADIMETAYGLQTKKTFADKKYEEKVRAVAKAREKALESRDVALDRQKQRYEKKIEDLKAHNQEMRANRKARREDSEARTKLLKIARRLDRFKTTAAKREQIDALIGDLDLVAKGMTEKTLENLHDLRDWYSDRKETDPDFIADSNIEKKLERLSKKHIKDMDLADVRELYDVLSNIENELKTERKLINSQMRKDIKEAGRETIRNINNSKGLAMKIRGFDRFFINGTLSPLRQIRRVTGYNDNDPLYIATKELADGQRKMLDYQMTSWKAFDRFMKNKDFLKSINGSKAKEIEVTGIKDGKQYKTKITPDIRMAMYLASMNADNLRHIRDGGIKLPDIKLYKKGRISEAMEKGTIVKFSPSMLNEITSHMTKTEKEFAQEAYKYYNETSPKAINEVSEELKGYSLARVQNYYPIHTDSNFLSKEFEAMKFDGTIEGMGFLKERVRASNPILMTGLVDELTRSIEMNSKYVGLAIPVRNFGKIYGVSDVAYTEKNEGGIKTLEADYRGSVKDSISDKWGGAVASYIEKFMTDLQNGRKNYDDWGNFFSKLRSNYAGAVLTLNASVALKQAASYPTAAAVLGRAPLAKAMGNFGKVDLDLIAKYTPLQWYRSQGFSTTELGDIRSGNKQSVLNKYPMLNWIQGIDLATTRKLWKASEYYVQSHNKNLKKGTDEYYKAVAEIYNRVIEETQPNYTTMQRPGLLRSDNDIVLALNMFKTQPYQNFNILYDSIGNYAAKRSQYSKVKNADTKKALQDAGRDMRNAIDSQIMQLAVFAAMTSLWALFRRKDDKYRDKEGNLTFVSYLERLAKDMLANTFADVPFGSDIYGTVSSAITGEYYYGFSSVTDSSVTDLLDTFTKGYKTIGEWVEYAANDDPEKEKPDSDMYKDIVSVTESASRFMGAPFSNLKNLGTGIYGWVAISRDGKYVGTYEAQKLTFAKKSEMMDNLFQAYRHDKRAYEQIRKMMIDDGIKEDSIDYYMKKNMKEHKSDSEQKEYDSSMQTLEKSSIWKGASADDQEYYTGIIEKMSVGIEDTSTGYVTNMMKSGLTEEQVILYKLALKKVDKPSASGKYGSYTKTEREAAIRLLEKESSLTYAQKQALKG